eukprot:5509_1
MQFKRRMTKAHTPNMCRAIGTILLLSAMYLLGVCYSSFTITNQIGGDKEKGSMVSSMIRSGKSSDSDTGSECMVSFGQYNGHRYKSPGQTIGDGKCLVESKWMRVMQHVVKLTPTTPSSDIIDDWLFIDYHDRINVLVNDPSDSNRFLAFKQSKYSLEGRESLAVIGGIIEPGEEAETAAKREVNEEMDGVICKEFIPLGRFRTDVNRGIGWVNSFLAMNCEKSGKLDADASAMDAADEVGKPDTENQDLVSLSLDELKKSAKDGQFLEVQWSNTVALALLHLG